VSVPGLDPLWPLSLSIQGWTNVRSQYRSGDLQGRITDQSSLSAQGMPARRRPLCISSPVTPARMVTMTAITTGLLLEATGVSKAYGAVVALKSASLAVRPGEVHALMGANAPARAPSSRS